MADPSDTLRAIPAIDALVQRCATALPHASRPLLLEAIRDEVTRFRAAARAGTAVDRQWFEGPAFVSAVRDALARVQRPRHEGVLNATGILLHTGLGRAPLCDEARAAVDGVARYAIVEVDPDSGERDEREVRIARLLCDLTGAEAATVVNNNAGATLLALSALAAGREVVVSRGQLVEIGGGFRMPDVMAASGALMREVGTTNRTHRADYVAAMNAATGMLLKVHPSNFRMIGFTTAPTLMDLVELGRSHAVPVGYDLGSGLLRAVDLRPLHDEPDVRSAVETGADLIWFSGDKLLCGPQAGILVGRKDAVLKARRHPLFRALRPGKLDLAALEATLLVYRAHPEGIPPLPLFQALALPQAELVAAARALAARIERDTGARVHVRETIGFLGSGSAPAREFPGVAVALKPAGTSAEAIAARLRAGRPRVHARIEADDVLLELRSIFPDQREVLATAVVAALHDLVGEQR